MSPKTMLKTQNNVLFFIFVQHDFAALQVFLRVGRLQQNFGIIRTYKKLPKDLK